MSSVIAAKASVILAFKFVISGTGVENTLSLTYPYKKKSKWVITGDRGGQGVGPSLPIHLFGNVASKNRRTCEPQCGGAPFYWKILETYLISVKKILLVSKVSVQTFCLQSTPVLLRASVLPEIRWSSLMSMTKP